jgi:hypothetical protein
MSGSNWQHCRLPEQTRKALTTKGARRVLLPAMTDTVCGPSGASDARSKPSVNSLALRVTMATELMPVSGFIVI